MTTTIVEIAQNEIVSANVAHYVDRYRRFAAKTIESILYLGETVLEASKSLDDGEIKVFCGEVGIKHNSSTFRKMLLIGEKRERLESVAERLPSNWTTVYEIAKLEDSKFEALVESKVLKATATMGEIKKIVGDKEKKQEVGFSLRITADNAVRAIEVFSAMNRIAQLYGTKIRIENQDLFDEFESEYQLAA